MEPSLKCDLKRRGSAKDCYLCRRLDVADCCYTEVQPDVTKVTAVSATK